MKILIYLISFLLLGYNVFASTIYIDPSAGTNGDGSLATPFNTWNSVNNAYGTGSSFLMRKGTTEFGISLNCVGRKAGTQATTIGTYASGTETAMPIICPRAIINVGSWSVNNASLNIWEYNLNTQPNTFYWSANTATDPYGTETDYSDLSPLPEGAWGTTTPTGTTSYKLLWRPYQHVAGTMSVMPDPGSAGARLSYSQDALRNCISFRNSSNFALSGITVIGASDHGIYVDINASNGTVSNCLTTRCGSRGVANNPGNANAYPDPYFGTRSAGHGNGIHVEGKYTTIQDCESSYNEDVGCAIERIAANTPKPKNVLFLRCWSHHNGDHGLSIRGENNIDNDGTEELSQGEFRGCLSEYNGGLFGLRGIISADYGTGGARVNGGYGTFDSCTLRYNGGTGLRMVMSQWPTEGSTTAVLTIKNCLFYSNNQLGNLAEANAEHYGIYSNASASTGWGSGTVLIMENNTIINDQACFVQVGGGGMAMKFKNNFFAVVAPTVTNNDSFCFNSRLIPSDSVQSLLDSNNCISGTTSGIMRINFVPYTLSGWNALANVGTDYSNGTNTSTDTTNFISIVNSDFHLRGSSPLIGLGTTTSATIDIEGRVRPAAFSIGAYEWIGTNTVLYSGGGVVTISGSGTCVLQ